MLASKLPQEPAEQPSPKEVLEFDYNTLDKIRIEKQLTTQLKPHPRNEVIYGEEDVSELVEHIRESHWVKPLVCTSTGTIISGHRRWKAAIELRLKSVPVEVREFSDELAELEALLLENANRLKTTEQKVREAEAWKEVETHKAKTRQIVLAGTRPNCHPDLQENFPEGHKGQARDAIANRVGLGSGRNYEKAAKVVTQIDEEASLGHPEVAKVLRKVLNEQSVDAAHMLLKRPTQYRHAIANLIINGDAKTTKQAERMVKKSTAVEFNVPTGQATAGGAFIAEPQVSVNSNGDDVNGITQSEKEQSGKDCYKPAEEVVEVVDNFNFNSNGRLNSPASSTPVPLSAGRNYSNPKDISEESSANTSRAKAESEVSEICDVLDNIFATVQHFNDEQKSEVLERVVNYIRAENLGGVLARFVHQYELTELCHQCFCAMNEETFSGLKVEQIKLSGLTKAAIEYLNNETSQLLNEHQPSNP